MTGLDDDAIRAVVKQAHQTDPDHVEFDVAAGLAEIMRSVEPSPRPSSSMLSGPPPTRYPSSTARRRLSIGTGSISAAAIRYGASVFLPVAVASATAVAAASQGPTRAFWAVTAVIATAASAIFALVKERQARAASKTASVARAQLAAGLNRAGAPLLTVLGKVTTAKTTADLNAALDVLVERVVDIAQSQCGRHRRPGASVRAVYYARVDDRLERRTWAGRQSDTPPRYAFRAGYSDHETEVVRFAASEELVMADDLRHHAAPHFGGGHNSSYHSFIAVPVRAGDTNFGMLTVDSDLPGSLTEADKGHMILLAGVLAAGLAWQAHRTSPINPQPPSTQN